MALKLLLMTLCIVSHLQQQKGVNAKLIFTPSWSAADTAAQICDILHGGSDESGNTTITLQGHPSVLCSLQVTATDHSTTQITIPDKRLKSDYLYIERLSTDCPNKVMRIDGYSGSCRTVVHAKQFRVNLRGNISVLISEAPASSHNQPECSEDNTGTSMESPTTTTPHCPQKAYSDVHSCRFDASTGFCFFHPPPPDCNSTLNYREVSFRCSDPVGNKKSMMFYPVNMTRLYLNVSNIISIGDSTFKGLPVDSLRLGFNSISVLHAGVFDELSHMTGHLFLRSNDLVNLEPALFHNLTHLHGLRFDHNRVASLHRDTFQNLKELLHLKMHHNLLTELDVGLFRGLDMLMNIDISNNLLTSLPVGLFRGVPKLKTLLLPHNQLTMLDVAIFQDSVNLKTLSLAFNQLRHIHAGLFENLAALTFLDLAANNLHSIPRINHLPLLKHLNLEGNTFQKVHKNDLLALGQSAELFVSQPEICECYTPSGVNCSTSKSRSPYLTCDRLLSDRVLVLFMWLLGLGAIAGNIFVLWWRNSNAAKHNVQSRLLLNLAMSDLLMGLYMVIIASADVHFGEYFPVQAERWRTGIICRVAGVLSILSSEASVLYVTLISIDRFISIKYPHTKYKFSNRSTVVIICTVWVFAGMLGIIPAILSGRNPKFYDNSHVCIGIPLALVTSYSTHSFEKIVTFDRIIFLPKNFTQTRYIGSEPGMHFSTAIFVGLNSLCYMIILGCYAELLRVVYKTLRRGDGLDQEMKKQVRLTTKVTAIVATDFLCWCPIIVLGILVQSQTLTLPPSVFAWMVTVVLPLNSAINPFLYTISDLTNRGRQARVEKTMASDGTRISQGLGEGQASEGVVGTVPGKQPSQIVNASYGPGEGEVKFQMVTL